MANIGKISILKELKDFIIPLSDQEFAQLEKNILEEGCRDALTVWPKNDDTLILVDGHNRYKICQKYNISFKVRKVSFNDIDEVKIWMVENQIGRRNLTPDQLSYYRGQKYLYMKKKKGGYDSVKAKGQNNGTTVQLLANEFHVSESTIKREAKFAAGLNIVARSNPKLMVKILTGGSKVKRADVVALCDSGKSDRIVIKNEADLSNKAKIIRSELLDEVEGRIKKLEKEKIEKALIEVNKIEPAFLNREDRIRKIKGRIISAINRAINEKDVEGIKELKKLVDVLHNELF